MWVLGLNVLSRGITDSAIACGAAAGLALGAFRVEDGSMAMAGLLMILAGSAAVFVVALIEAVARRKNG